jgi:hypothetical protein
MTERERIQEIDFQQPETIDEALAVARPLRETVHPSITPQYTTRTLVMMPIDRVRWAAVLTGLFAALATLTLWSVLGLAIGLAIVTPGTTTGALGIGAGAWSAIGALIGLVVGGWAAARTAAVPGRANGALNGAMVWLATIPLVLYLLGSGIASFEPIASGIVATGAQIAAQLVGQVAPENAPTIAITGDLAAWGTLFALLLGLVAATFGGLMGARSATDLTTTWVLPPEHTLLQ